MARIFFTYSERTDKKYKVSDALKFANAYMLDRNLGTCTNAVSKRNPDEAITLMQLNDITEDIIGDSLYYNVRL